jgi:hypothetical protein
VSERDVLVHNACGDVTFPTQESAMKEALSQYGAIDDPALIEVKEVYGKNDALKGPNGEPYEVVHAMDENGNMIEIQHHKWGHTFNDVNPPVYEPPHYHGVTSPHIFYDRI